MLDEKDETISRLLAERDRYREMWEEAAREALRWGKRAEDLKEAIGEYILWEPGRRGHAAALRRLVVVFRAER
jgi:hypothetical protein